MSLSVVIPTLNCATAIPAHLASMGSWLDLATEIVVVDSHSTDGTSELILATLTHPGLRLLSHPRGLYQSWNYGIAQTTGDWIYISTVGDSITREQIEHLLEVGKSMKSDVVVSPPAFEFSDGVADCSHSWPIEQIIRHHGITVPTELDPAALFFHALHTLPESYLGSSASNLYRGDHLRARPFPTSFGVVGDTAWSIQHVFDTHFCFSPRIGSRFLHHEKAYAPADFVSHARIVESLIAMARQTFATAPKARICELHGKFIDLQEGLHRARTAYGTAHRVGFPPWYLSPSAWLIRADRNRLRRAVRRLARELQEEILQFPCIRC